MEDEEDAGAGAPLAAEAPPAPNARMPMSYLALCDKGLRDVFRQAMQGEIVQELQARLREHERVRRDLGGFMYLSPNKMPEWDAETSARVTHHHISTPHHVHVNVHLTIRYFRR